MDKKTKAWVKTMELFNKYWGCHQLPERSYFIKGYQLPVCARCEGMILGELFSIILIITGIRITLPICVSMLTPLIIDGSIQYKTSYNSNNLKRIFTGIFFGVGFIYIIFYAIIMIIHLIFPD